MTLCAIMSFFLLFWLNFFRFSIGIITIVVIVIDILVFKVFIEIIMNRYRRAFNLEFNFSF